MTALRPLSSEVQALLDEERGLTPLPTVVRARLLARARAALAAGPLPHPVPVHGVRRFQWAAVVALTCVTSGAVGAVAYHVRARTSPPASAPAVAPRLRPPARTVASAHARPRAEEPPVVPEIKTPRPSPVDLSRAELNLLKQARAAVAREDYASALPLLAEHAHRFKDGHLTEEREALRIKALVGLGRAEEARHAADTFETHYPRSVLLPAVRRMANVEP